MARALLSAIVCASVVSNTLQRHEYDRFYYINSFASISRRTGDDNECNTCYGDDCFNMNSARCNFYSATSVLLYGNNEDDSDEIQMRTASDDIRVQVDLLIMNMVEQENICLGCKNCICDENGLWNCSIVQNCQQDDPLNVDHHTLITVIDTLFDEMKTITSDDTSLRIKRWTYLPEVNESKPHKLSYAEIAEWMYAVKPLIDDRSNIVDTLGMSKKNTKIDVATINPTNDEIEGKAYHRRKPLNLSNDTTMDNNYMNFDDTNVTYNTFNDAKTSDNFIDILDAIDNRNNLEVTTEFTTEVVIDLLEAARNKIGMDTSVMKFNSSDNEEKWFDQSDEIKNITFENTNDIFDFTIVKRDVSELDKLYNYTATNYTKINVTTITPINNDTQINVLLKSSMMPSLDILIASKEKELKNLLYVKGKILEYLIYNKTQNDTINMTRDSMMGNINNAYFSYYNIEINPKISKDYRKNNKNKTDNYLDRLKLDILVVLKDLLTIQKYIGKHHFSPPLKNLVRAMRHYLHHSENIFSEKNPTITKTNEKVNMRRHWTDPYPVNEYLVKRYLIDIITLIDQDMPQSNALATLTPKSKEILRRIIKMYNFQQNSIKYPETNDPQYNFANELNDIGIKWKQMASNIMNCKPVDKVYNLKSLQLVLLSDITKITNAIKKLDFFSSRRLTTVKDNVSERELIRINNELKSIHIKVKKIFNLQQKIPKEIHRMNSNFNSTKKETLIKYIRNLLKNSKKDIVGLLRKKVPKAEIVKELARKKLNEIVQAKLTKYRSVMRKWQKNLSISRKKRAALTFDDIKNKIKNILPKYLRGKVHNGMKNSTKNKRRAKPKNKKHNRRNNASTTMATTKLTTAVQPHE
ncbi:unnamed protein product [Diatraea saccharalis]|uniref:Uncharacterized protein n=1 Tax=Diatraea saccharalis TaxID=40085 RepID=A0A9N9WIK5_9NEOP|nr:unnamed protein product [Diatraea saccharalis]